MKRVVIVAEIGGTTADPDPDMNARLTRLVKYLEETHGNASEKE